MMGHVAAGFTSATQGEANRDRDFSIVIVV